MTLHLTPVEILAGVGGLVVLVTLWRITARTARRAAETARAGARLVSLAGRVGVTAGLIGGVQWLVITHPGNTTLLWVVLGVPALLAGYTLTRALTVTTSDVPRHRGGRR
jgi:uncharacterized membrane protein